MKCDEIQDKILDYIEKRLSENETAKIAAHIDTCENCAIEFKEIQALFSLIDKDQMEIPSQHLHENFSEMLAEEKQQQNEKVIKMNPDSNWKSYLQIAASILLIMSSFFFGKFQQTQASRQEISALKNESLVNKQTTMLALMENKSASKRIEGVQYIEKFSDPDPAIVDALVKRMLNDENTNVRLTATNALQAFIGAEAVKDGYIKALEKEKDPGIQIVIIQVLVKIQEKKAIKPMQQLLEQDETQPFIKEEIKTVLQNII